MTKREYSLREKKHARTKIALMNAFIERLRNSRFENISIKDVCKSAEISEGTFFNYFPEKINVITYYVNLMTMKVIWKARQKASLGKHIALINAFFEGLADEFIKINITYELISILVIQHEKPKKTAISDIEKLLFFPDLAGIETVPNLLMDEFFKECLEGALQNGELPRSVNINDALVSLMTITVGTMIAIKFSNIKNIKYQYTLAFDLIKETGPGGFFTATDHTASHYRAELWQPSIFSRENLSAWLAGNHKTEVEKAGDVCASILKNYHPAGIDEATERELLKVITSAEKII